MEDPAPEGSDEKSGTRAGVRCLNHPFGQAYSVAVSPVTGAVYVTGSSMGSSTSGEDYTTIGYRG